MKYLLDTNICIYFLNQQKKVVETLQLVSDTDVAVSIITIAELQFGAFNSAKISHNLERIKKFEEIIQTIPLTPKVTEEYAKIKANLRKTGKIIDDFDLLIGATALVNNLILITNNQQHFNRIPDLKIENWAN